MLNRQIRFLVLLCVVIASLTENQLYASCEQRFEDAIKNILTENSPNLDLVLSHLSPQLKQMSPRKQESMVIALENPILEIDSYQENTAWVALSNSFAERVLHSVFGYPELSELAHNTFVFWLAPGEHPYLEILLIHEFSHLKRSLNQNGNPSSTFNLLFRFSKTFRLAEERKALADDYDFIVAAYSSSDLPSLQQKYPAELIEVRNDSDDNSCQDGRAFILNNALQFCVRGALILPKQAYIDLRLEQMR